MKALLNIYEKGVHTRMLKMPVLNPIILVFLQAYTWDTLPSLFLLMY